MKRSVFLAVLSIICFVGLTIAQIPTNGLIAYYPFNDNANDESGNGNDGVVSGATLTTDRFGSPNSAYLFNGTSDFILVANNSSLQSPTNQFTISVWVSPTDLSALHWVLDKRMNANVPPFTSYSINAAYFSTWRTGINTNTLEATTGKASIVSGSWVNLMSVYDGTKLSLYVNGAFDSSVPANGNIIYSNLPLYIGKSPNNGGFMKGKIDEIRIYNRALTSNEISAISGSINGIGNTQQYNTNTIKIFPNPASGYVNIDFENYSTSLGYTLKIVNNLGCTLFNCPINNPQSLIDLSGIESGIYFIHIVNDQSNTIVIKKIVLM